MIHKLLLRGIIVIISHWKKEPKSKPQFDMQEKCAALTFIHSEINN